jgi:hypothetical protein
MITQETIKKQANEFADNFDSDSPTFGNIKRRVASFSFRSGVNFAIQQIEKKREEIEAKSVKYEDELEKLNSDLHKKDAIIQAQEEYITKLENELKIESPITLELYDYIKCREKIEEAKK